MGCAKKNKAGYPYGRPHKNIDRGSLVKILLHVINYAITLFNFFPITKDILKFKYISINKIPHSQEKCKKCEKIK